MSQGDDIRVGTRIGDTDCMIGLYDCLALYDNYAMSAVTVTAHYDKGVLLTQHSTKVNDTFTDSDGTAMASHTPDTDDNGGGWSTPSGAWTIQGNAAEATNLTSSDYMIIDAGSADVIMTYSGVTSYAGSTAYEVIYGIFRYSDTSNYLRVSVSPLGGGIGVVRVEGGGHNTLATGSMTTLSGDNKSFDIEIRTHGDQIIIVVSTATQTKTFYLTSSFNNTETICGMEQLGIGTYTPHGVDNFKVLEYIP